MTTRVLICNQKGGVGKTTIADELAFALERRGAKVSFMTLDSQGGSVHESSMGSEDDDWRVIDSPGHLTKTFAEDVRHVDMIVIPMLPGRQDFEPTMRTLDIIDAAAPDVPVGIVLNRFDERRKLDQSIMRSLERGGLDVWATIPTSTLFGQASTLRCSVYDMDETSRAAMAVEALADRIQEEVSNA